MKTVTGSVVSSKPISLSKAASTLSSFLSADNGASQALCAYLRRASASFNELKQLHKDLKSSRSDRKHRLRRSEVSNDLEVAVDNPYGTELKTETEDKPSGRVEIDVESSDRDKGVVAVEKKRKKHKKSEDGLGKSRISDNNGEIEATEDLVENNVARGKDRKKHEDKKSLGDVKEEKSTNKDDDDENNLVELSTKKKKKKKKKKKREEDVDDLQNNSGGAIEKEEMPVSDSKELKRKERKKRKNQDLQEEGGDDGSEEQQSTKRRKGNL